MIWRRARTIAEQKNPKSVTPRSSRALCASAEHDKRSNTPQKRYPRYQRGALTFNLKVWRQCNPWVANNMPLLNLNP